jgi:hypothetical protein
VTLCVTPTDGTQFIYRDQTGQKTVRVPIDVAKQALAVPKAKFPCWLKLVRTGNAFVGYESLDGVKWQLSGKITLALAPATLVGLAASSHKTDILTTATFDHVQVGAHAGEAAAK